MRLLLRMYSACCLIFVGFLWFFLIPFDSLPFSNAVSAIIAGGILIAVVGGCIFRVHSREGFEFGWFLANRGGFWFVAAACFGIVLLLSGICLYFAPQIVEPAFERGAWPVAGMLVVIFWFSLIFMFGFLSFNSVGQTFAFVRFNKLKKVFGAIAIALVCLAMAGVFFSLFLEVINDVFFRISIATQWLAIWIFLGLLAAIGGIHGILAEPSYYLEQEDLDPPVINDDPNLDNKSIL